jgi:phosphoglycerate dehydrogenase-like enzyme
MKLLLTGALKHTKEQLVELESLGFEIIFVQDEKDPLNIDVSDIDVVICNGLFLYNDITKFKNLKLIQLTSAGMDRVPLDYIKKNGIQIFNTRGVYSIPMSEWVVLKILEIYKKSKQFYKNQQQQKWEKQRDLLELTNKNAAIIGFGSIGIEIAKRLKPFEVKIISVDIKNIKSEFVDEFFFIDDIDEVLRKSDIIVLTLPLTKETKYLVDKEKINQMKEGSVFVNVSRGAVIDEKALVKAIRKGKFLGVALDVFEEEPLNKNNPLWEFDRVIITPHNAFVSDMVNERLFELIIQNLMML